MTRQQERKVSQLAMQARLLSDCLIEADAAAAFKRHHGDEIHDFECTKARTLADELEVLDWELSRDALW